MQIILPADPGASERPAYGAWDKFPGRHGRFQSHEMPPADGVAEPTEPSKGPLASLHLKPGRPTLANLCQVYLAPMRLSLDPSTDAPIVTSVACVENVIIEGRTAYGISTGFGLLTSARTSPADLEKFQCSIVLPHAAGVDETLDDVMARLVTLLRVNNLARGFSNIRRKMIDALIALINAEVYLHIPLKGSMDTSNDLIPLARVSLILVDEGRARHRGK